MNYLITGGTGLIGKKLISKLQPNNSITVLTRNITNNALTGDVTFIDKLTIADIEKNDIVINLAGEPIADKRWSTAQKEKICQSRWSITEQLSSLIKVAKSPPQLFISGSAIGIYGRQDNTSISENFTQYNDEFTHRVCQRWEAIALSASSDNTKVTLLRTGIVLSTNGGALGKMLLPFKLGVGGKIGTGEQVMSWIHLDDMVNAIIHIIDNKLSGAINMTSPNAVTNGLFSKELAKALHRPCLFTTPAPLLKLIFGEMSDLLLFGQNVYPNQLKESGFIFKHPTLTGALQNLLK